MALRLSAALGRLSKSWLAMLGAYDLWVARQHVDLEQAGKPAFCLNGLDHDFRVASRCCGFDH